MLEPCQDSLLVDVEIVALWDPGDRLSDCRTENSVPAGADAQNSDLFGRISNAAAVVVLLKELLGD